MALTTQFHSTCYVSTHHIPFCCALVWNLLRELTKDISKEQVRGELHDLPYVYLREVYGFSLSCKCGWMMNVYILLSVLKSSTDQQSQHVHFAKLYKIALIVIIFRPQYCIHAPGGILPCGVKKKKQKNHSWIFIQGGGEKPSKCKIRQRLGSISSDTFN